MSAPQIDPTPDGNGALSARDVVRILASIRVDARKIKDALNGLMRDAEKLEGGGSPGSAVVLRKAAIAMEVGLDSIREVFKLTL